MSSNNIDTFICENCSKSIPKINMVIHSVQCARSRKRSADNPQVETSSNLNHQLTEVVDLVSPMRQNVVDVDIIDEDDDTLIEDSSNPVVELDDDDIENDETSWSCGACTYKNHGATLRCGVCDTLRFTDAGVPTDLTSRMTDEYEMEAVDATPRVDNRRNNFNNINTTNGDGSKWACSQCTYENGRSYNECAMCGNTRSPQSSFSQRLIEDDSEEEDNIFYRPTQRARNQLRYPTTRSRSGYENTAVNGALLGAGIGAGAALLNGRSIARGATEGAGMGMLGGLLFRAMAEELMMDNELEHHIMLGNMIGSLVGEGTENNQQGVSQNILDQLPSRVFHQDRDRPEQCPICIENFKTGDKVRTLPCLHQFHEGCVDNWLRNKNTCPICKHQINIV